MKTRGKRLFKLIAKSEIFGEIDFHERDVHEVGKNGKIRRIFHYNFAKKEK